ncbi:MAG: PilN domain-containing protein [Betaproteobacteria bacterium]
MIFLNLLPHREAARVRRRQQFYQVLALSALVGVVISAGVMGWFYSAIASQGQTNLVLEREIKVLDQQNQDVKDLEAQIVALKLRQRAVEDLQSDRNVTVRLISELARQFPSGILLSAVTQTGADISISGIAQTNEKVSELLVNLGKAGGWFAKPELVEIKSDSYSLPTKVQIPVVDFKLRAALVRKATPETPAPEPEVGGSGPQAGALGNP